jgi:multimeric flavodoxin WrbA
MKILVLESSPHKNGSSNLLADSFIRGAKEVGNVMTVVDVARAKIGPCMGCDACRNAGACLQTDDFSEIMKQICNTDMIVL